MPFSWRVGILSLNGTFRHFRLGHSSAVLRPLNGHVADNGRRKGGEKTEKNTINILFRAYTRELGGTNQRENAFLSQKIWHIREYFCIFDPDFSENGTKRNKNA